MRDFFKNEETVLKHLNPFFFISLSKLYLTRLPTKVMPHLAHLFNTALYFLLILQEDLKSSIQEQLLGFLLRLLKFTEANLAVCTANGTLQSLLSNELFVTMIKDIDYEDSSATYNNQQKMLLEMQMKLMDLQSEARTKGFGKVQSGLENSEGILQVRRGKTVLSEKQSFEFLKYLIHYEDLEDH